jgi:hypothetical protein
LPRSLWGFNEKEMDGAIFHFQEIQNEYPLFWTVLIFTIGLIESKGISSLWDQGFGGESTGIAGIREDVICGNLGLDPLGIVANEDEEKFLVSPTCHSIVLFGVDEKWSMA